MIKKTIITLGLALSLLGCEQDSSNSSGNISADNPTLEQIANNEADFLVNTFKVNKPSAYCKTEKAKYSNGTFDYEGMNVYGIFVGDTIIVSDRYFPNVIRHELLHACGYNHNDKEINGVQVSKYIDAWDDAAWD